MRRHERRVLRLVGRIVRDDAEAEDITQEAFVRAYQALDRFEGHSQPYTWLYRIAVNLSLNKLRSQKPRRFDVDSDDPRIGVWVAHACSNETNPARVHEQQEMGRALCDAVDQLNDTLRTTLLLACVEGIAHQQVAEVLGCKEGTVSWRVHEARRQVRAYLQQRGLWSEEAQP